MDNFNLNIGKKLYALRKKKGYSLSKLEEVTGVSKSMLGQIERGESNPTVKTLWKIAKSLNVSFSFFIEEEKSNISVISASNIIPVIEGNSKYKVYPLIPFDRRRCFEIYMIEIEAGYRHNAEAHYIGVEEYIIVFQGVLEISVDQNEYKVHEGDIIYFKADRPHTYHNKTNSLLKAYVLIYYPSESY